MSSYAYKKRLPMHDRMEARREARRKSDALHPILQILYRGFNRARLLAYRPKAACEYSGMRVSEIEKRDPHFFD